MENDFPKRVVTLELGSQILWLSAGQYHEMRVKDRLQKICKNMYVI